MSDSEALLAYAVEGELLQEGGAPFIKREVWRKIGDGDFIARVYLSECSKCDREGRGIPKPSCVRTTAGKYQ